MESVVQSPAAQLGPADAWIAWLQKIRHQTAPWSRNVSKFLQPVFSALESEETRAEKFQQGSCADRSGVCLCNMVREDAGSSLQSHLFSDREYPSTPTQKACGRLKALRTGRLCRSSAVRPATRLSDALGREQNKSVFGCSALGCPWAWLRRGYPTLHLALAQRESEQAKPARQASELSATAPIAAPSTTAPFLPMVQVWRH